MAWHIKNVLENNAMPAMVKNEQLYSVAGEIPVTECMPEVWVVDPADFAGAEALIRKIQQENETTQADWICSTCQESNGGNFEICWSCQSPLAAD